MTMWLSCLHPCMDVQVRAHQLHPGTHATCAACFVLREAAKQSTCTAASGAYLWRDVGRRADCGLGLAVQHRLAVAKVTDLDTGCRAAVQQGVLQLQVSVAHALQQHQQRGQPPDTRSLAATVLNANCWPRTDGLGTARMLSVLRLGT